jgi:hypothetical protein
LGFLQFRFRLAIESRVIRPLGLAIDKQQRRRIV